MGEKIANQDYADPSKLFVSSRNPSQTNLTVPEPERIENTEFDLMGEPEKIDMTIDEKDVFEEIEKRLEEEAKIALQTPVSDTGQNFIPIISKSSQSCKCGSATENVVDDKSDGGHNLTNSSQNSECLYEAIMEENLNENISRRSVTTVVIKNNSNLKHHRHTVTNGHSETYLDKFKSTTNDNKSGNNQSTVPFKNNLKISDNNRVAIKRPTKAPPPIPVKPKGLSNINNCLNDSKCNEFSKTALRDSCENMQMKINNSTVAKSTTKCENIMESNSKSWVKAMVGRFE